MIRSRLRLKALGLCIVALGLMALAASAVQAEKGANWMVNGSNVTEKLLPEIGITEVEAGEHLLTKILGVAVDKSCKTVELIGVKLEAEGKAGTNAKVRFTGCVMILDGKVTPACEPHTGAEKGVLESKAGKGLLILSGGEGVVRVEPASGEIFMTVETGSECAVGQKIPVIGKFTIKDSKHELTTEAVTHLVEEGPGTEVWLISKTAEHKVTFDGSAIGGLVGPHLGLKASGLPG